MPTLLRPLKEGTVRTYQEKVALGFPDILASEADADLETIYTAWNGGIGTAELLDGAVTQAKLAPDARLWSDTGSALTTINVRNLTVGGTEVVWGTGTIKAGVLTNSIGNAYLHSNNPYAPQDLSKPSWGIYFSADGDIMGLLRRAAGAAAGAGLSFPLSMGSTQQLVVSQPIRCDGSGGGIRCQNVGEMQADGSGHSVAFGWNGTLQARVDSNPIGTVTVTSDARVKLDVQEDVPGLTAVLAMRPVSFAYDQTQRPIGFPKGRHYGLIAQEVEPHTPLVVEADDSDEHWKELDYRLLVPVLIRAVQELTARVVVLEAR